MVTRHQGVGERMNPDVIINIREKLGQHALQLSVIAATALLVATLGIVANGNTAVHEVIHDLRHALGLPCH